MARKRRRIVHNPVTDSERSRCCLYGTYGGFHHRYIAKRLYGNGNPNYRPSDSEVRRVGNILRQAGISTRDYRNGETDAAERIANVLARRKLKISKSQKPDKVKVPRFRFVA